ncbi:hypothetical protein Plhal710r2_c040g0139181 [Plasmopara halstedii]
MIAERSISRRLCFLLLSCVAVSIYSEVAQLEAMMMSNEQTIAQRHDRALTSTPDQMSTSLEERGAPVAVEEEAGMLSRFVSYFKPSNLWKKLASSWIMRFFMPHIYLRHSCQQATSFLSNCMLTRRRTSSAVAAGYMVSILATKHEVQLVNSIPKTEVVNDKLAFGDEFEAALINYLRGNEKSETFKDSLKTSLLALSGRLQKDESSELIGVKMQEQIMSVSSGNEEKLVDAVNVQPVHKLSSLQEVVSEPVTLVTPRLSTQEEEAAYLLNEAGLDKVVKDIFNSKQFKVWSEQMKTHFPSKEDGGASIMLTTLAKLDREKVLDSIPTTKVVDDELAFGRNFRAALMDYIALAKDTEDPPHFAQKLQESLLALIKQLEGELNWSFGEILKGELLVSSIKKNKRNLVHVVEDRNVRIWYDTESNNDKERAISVLYRRLKLQGITNQQIGEAVHQDPLILNEQVMADLVHYQLSIMLKSRIEKDVILKDSYLITWFQEASVLNARANELLIILREAHVHDAYIVRYCSDLAGHSDKSKELLRRVQAEVTNEWSEMDDAEVLNNFMLRKFSFDDPVVQAWVLHVNSQKGEAASSFIADLVFKKFEDQVPEIIEAERGKRSSSNLRICNELQKLLDGNKSKISS